MMVNYFLSQLLKSNIIEQLEEMETRSNTQFFREATKNVSRVIAESLFYYFLFLLFYFIYLFL